MVSNNTTITENYLDNYNCIIDSSLNTRTVGCKVIDDDYTYIFSDGFSITGKELCNSLKILRKIIEKDYPEELV